MRKILNKLSNKKLNKTKTDNASKKLSYEELFGPPLKLDLKKKRLTRADYYE